jgi:hypothetical protein
MDDYIKSLEEQNEELKQKLAVCEAFHPYWVKDDREPPPFINIKNSQWWYLMIGKETVLAAIHHVKDVSIEGYKICILKTDIGWKTSCNVECEFHETATTDTFEKAQKYCEERILDGI